MKRLAVATAINEEYKLLRGTLKQVQKLTFQEEQGYKSCSGRFEGIEIDLALTYMGPSAAQEVAQKWLTPEKHFGLLIVGYCGGLSLPLKIGDVVLPSSVKMKNETSQMWEELHLDLSVNEELGKTLMSLGVRYRNVPMLTVPRIVETPNEREEIFRATQAEAVDMESFCLVKIAREKKIPVAVLRVVSDDCETELPDFNAQISGSARIESYQLAKALVANPKLALNLRKNMIRADESIIISFNEVVNVLTKRWLQP